jgi:hypothetical protein
MFSLGLPQNRQGLAHGLPLRQNPFAGTAATGDTENIGLAAATSGLICLNCYPSPIFRPDPSRIRPFFCAHAVAQPAQFAAHVDKSHGIAFSDGGIVAIFAPIKTRTRGKNRCRSNHSFWWAWPQWPLPGACRTRPRAGLVAPLPGLSLPTRWMKTWWQGQRLGRLAGQAAAICRARSTASKATETPAFGPNRTTLNHAGCASLAWFFHARGERHV